MEPTENIGESDSDIVGAACSGAVGALNTGGDGSPEVLQLSGTDPALILVIEVWEKLPNAAKSQILKIADTPQ